MADDDLAMVFVPGVICLVLLCIRIASRWSCNGLCLKETLRCSFFISPRSSSQEVCLGRGQESVSILGKSIMDKFKNVQAAVDKSIKKDDYGQELSSEMILARVAR